MCSSDRACYSCCTPIYFHGFAFTRVWVEIISCGVWIFWDKVHKIYCILLETSCEIFTPFYHTVARAFVTRLIATLTSRWRIYLWPQITVWVPRGSPRSRLKHDVALNVSQKLYFTLRCAFKVNPFLHGFPFFFSRPAYLSPLNLSILEKLTHLFYEQLC